jgi:hypothetical protein
LDPKIAAKGSSALVEAKKYTMFGDNKLYYNLNNGTEKPEGTKKLSASRSVLTFVTREWREVPKEEEVKGIILKWHADSRDGCHGGKLIEC